MSLANLIPFTLYKDLKVVRQARNDWIHKLKPVSRETAQASIDLAERMMALVENLDLQVSVIPRIDP